MNFLILGASAGLGRALAERLAKEGNDLFLAASDERDLKALAADLTLKHSVKVGYCAVHLSHRREWLTPFAEEAKAFAPSEGFDGLFFPIGYSVTNDLGALDEETTRQILETCFLGIALLVSRFLPEFLARGTGYIVGFGSIAAIRGRGSNVVYSASKRALLSFFESLQHLTAGTGLRVHFFQLGYLDTQQTFGKKLLFPKCPPAATADHVWRSLRRRSSVTYYPGFWKIIALALKALPQRVFNRLKF